jgi:hypothetical protein
MNVQLIEDASDTAALVSGLRKALRARAVLVIIVEDGEEEGKRTIESRCGCVLRDDPIAEERLTLGALSDRLVESLQRAALSLAHGMDVTSTRPPIPAAPDSEAGN